MVTRSEMHLGSCIAEKVHKGNGYKLFLKVPCAWTIPLSKEALTDRAHKNFPFCW